LKGKVQMKISKSTIRRIIKEELSKELMETVGKLGEPYSAKTLEKAGLRARREREPVDLQPFSDRELEDALEKDAALAKYEKENPGFIERITKKVMSFMKSHGVDIAE
jgi:hypothetical protein